MGKNTGVQGFLEEGIPVQESGWKMNPADTEQLASGAAGSSLPQVQVLEETWDGGVMGREGSWGLDGKRLRC